MANGLLTDQQRVAGSTAQQEQSLFDRIFAGRKSNIAGDIFKPRPEGFYNTKQKDEMAAGSQAREQAYGQDTTSISDKQRTQSQSLLPEATVTGKSFMDKLQSGIDKIFNMQENDPAAYRRMMSGIDLYSRSQTQDLATALLGNNKFNQDQAKALLQSNKNAIEMKVLEAKYAKSLQPEAASTSEIEVAKGIVSGKVDKDDVDSIANYIAGDAKVLMQSIPGLAYNQAVVIAFQQAQQSGILKEKGFFKKKLEFDPNATSSKGIINLSTLKEKFGDNYKTKQKEAEEQGYIINSDG